jgi:CDP-diacylglycerol pyrophosphatase
MLVRAYDKVENYDVLKWQHTNQQNRIPKHQRVPFISPMTKVSENAGYVMLKDPNKVVVFYCNDLKLTPTSPLLPMDNKEAIRAVNGVCTI